MKDDKAFDNIIDSMGGIPPSLTPPPTKKEQAVLSLKVMTASILALLFQSALVGWLFMLGYEIAASAFGWTVTDVGFWPSTMMALIAIAIVATLRRATA